MKRQKKTARGLQCNKRCARKCRTSRPEKKKDDGVLGSDGNLMGSDARFDWSELELELLELLEHGCRLVMLGSAWLPRAVCQSSQCMWTNYSAVQCSATGGGAQSARVSLDSVRFSVQPPCRDFQASGVWLPVAVDDR